MEPYTYMATILRIVDGDTIDVRIDLGFSTHREERLRLLGVDTPEIRTKDLEEKNAGLLALGYVANALQVGQKYLIRTVIDRDDKFGRPLATFYHRGPALPSLNSELINQRLGVPYNGQSKDAIAEAHRANRQYLYDEGLLV